MKKLEIACFNLESALVVAKSNADRIEFCADVHLGGTTPRYEDIVTLCENSEKELMIMIRPRGGNFCYSKDEYEQMKISILAIKKLPVDGFVFGILDENHQIDIQRNLELVELAKPLPCAFHRAFDRTPHLEESLEQVIQLGFKTILTSGMASHVDEGKMNLQKLVTFANDRITIMPGGGLRSTNIQEIATISQAHDFHSSALTDESGISDLEEINRLKSLIN